MGVGEAWEGFSGNFGDGRYRAELMSAAGERWLINAELAASPVAVGPEAAPTKTRSARGDRTHVAVSHG